MDLASLVSAQASKSSVTKHNGASGAKYLRKADLEAQRQEEYLAEQAALQKARVAKAEEKRKRDDEEASRHVEREEKRRRLAEESRVRREEEETKKERARRKKLGLPDLDHGGRQGGEDKQAGESQDEDTDTVLRSIAGLSDEEVRAGLRSILKPVTLFGEDVQSRKNRYQSAMRARMRESVRNFDDPIPTTLAPVPGSEMHVPKTISKSARAKDTLYIYRQLSSYFNMLLREWAVTLSKRDEETKQSSQGKQAEANMRACLAALRPLFLKFEQQSLAHTMLAPLLEIVVAMQERRYVDANDGYLTLSIGKAAWPIGVTMVGIHERSAREKLNEGERGGAHVMGDENTRRWLQAVKRCLSFAQVRWPPFDIGQLMG